MKVALKVALIICFFVNIANITYAAPQDNFFENQDRKIRDRQLEEENARRTQQEMVRLKKEKKTLSVIELPKEELSFHITEIKIQGQHAEKFWWAQKYLNNYLNQNIGFEGINLLIKKLNEAFIDKGFITTQLYIKEQDISSGILTLDLMAGTVNKIRFKEENTWGTWRNAVPILPGDLLNIRDIEQGLEQLRRLSSQEVDIDIQPAEQPGQSDLIIAIQRKRPWKIVTSFDDSGSRGTGKNQMSTSVQMENLLSINDILYVSYNEDVAGQRKDKGTLARSFYYSVPWGKQTLSISKSHNRYHQTVKTAVVPFQYSGTTDNFSLTLTHLLKRDQTKKTNLELTLATKERYSFLDDTEIEVQRQETSTLKLGITHRQYMGTAILDTALRFQKGVPWFGAQPGVTDNVPGGATTRYNLWSLDVNINMPIQIGKLKGRYNINFRGQKTNNPIYGSEYFSIGGRYTVRGFDGEQSLSAENGFILRNEFSLEYIKYHQLYANIDYGKVQGPSTKWLLGKELLGAAVGIRGNFIKGMLSYDFFVGWPLKKPDGFRTSNKTIGFQLTMQI